MVEAEQGLLQQWAAGWRRQPLWLRVLRGFLGFTFLYAGLQKLGDPNFFHTGSLSYIGTQLNGFAKGSPIGPVLRLLAKLPVLTGAVTALGEIAIGVGTLLGVGSVWCGLAGFGISVILFLSASWRAHPYFIGSDLVYAVAWLALCLGIVDIERTEKRAALRKRVKAGRPHVKQTRPGRREFLRVAGLAGITLIAGGIAKASAGAPRLGSFPKWP